MQERKTALVDQLQRADEHLLGLGRKSGDDIGAERDVGPQPAHLGAKLNGVVTGMPPLHPL